MVSGFGVSFPLGRVVNHDPRSKNFPAQPRKLLRPRSRLHELRAPALRQGDIGSCVGHTAAQWLNCTVTKHNRKRGFMPGRPTNRTKYLDDHNARTLYSNATIFDQFGGVYPPDDTGSSGLGGAKALQKFGFITEYRHVFDFPTLIAVVIDQPVMLGINWYEGMYDPDDHGVIRPTGSVEGGHEILVRGIDLQRKRFRLRNHWGVDWGIKGDCYLDFADMERLMNEQGDVTVPGIIK